MNAIQKIHPATATPDLQLAFDVGHSSIGWAVLEKAGAQTNDIKILGCGSVVFRADDCLASSRRAYRRQRRHIRSTRQRIARMKMLLKHLGVLTEDELNKPGCAWPWKLAAQVLQGDKLLTWPELWDVLRWYAHNRGYDGNQRWAKNSETESEELDDAALDKILNDASATEDQKNDAKKVIEAKNLMRRHGLKTMAEAFCKELGVEPIGKKKSSMIRFKGLNAAFPRKIVEAEVLRILQAHKFCEPKLIHLLLAKKLSKEDRAELKVSGIKIPKRYEGGLLFGQLVPRFDNRIISACPITWQKEFERATEAIDANDKSFMQKHGVNLSKHDASWWTKHIADKFSKVPSRNCPEFLNFRWAMLLANMKVARPGERDLTPLTVSERKVIDAAMREAGAMTEGELKKLVRETTKSGRDKLDQMFMEELDAKKALVFDPVQELINSNAVSLFWKLFPERLQKRLRGQWRRGKVFSLAQIRKQLESLGGDVGAFDVVLQNQLDAHNTKAKKKEKQISREDFLKKTFPAHPLKLDGRAPFARHLLKQAYEEVLAGKPHPKQEGGCLFLDEKIREKQLNREIVEQTNNHLVRHRLLILERLLADIVKEYTGNKKERVGKITIEVNRDLREMSGKDSKAKDREMREKLGNIRAVEKYVLDRLPEKYHGRVNGSFLRKARVADDLDWRCPYTGEMIQPIHFITGVVELDHVIPYAIRPSNSLDSLVATFSVVNKMKRKQTALQFMKAMGGQPVCFISEKGQTEKIDGMPNLSLLQLRDFKAFVAKLKIRSAGEHIQDKERRLRRQRLLEIENYEQKEFLPRDLTQTSQLVRLGAQVLRKNLPHLTTGDVTSLPGSVTGAVRKSWNVLGCLSAANPQVLNNDAEKTIKTKTEIRGITHLHHALDACVLGLASYKIPKDGRVWELIVKRNLNDLEKQQLAALGIFDFNAENRFEMRDLDNELKNQIRQRLAEKRVVQHIPARMDGLRVEQNTWRIVAVKDDEVVLKQRIRQPDGKRPEKIAEEKPAKLLGLKPINGKGKLAANKGVLVIPDNFGIALDPQPTVIPFHKVWTRLDELKKTNGNKMPRVIRNGQVIEVPSGRYKGVWRVFSAKATLTLDLGSPDKVRLESKGEDQKREVQVKTLIKDGMILKKNSFTGVAVCPTTSSA